MRLAPGATLEQAVPGIDSRFAQVVDRCLRHNPA